MSGKKVNTTIGITIILMAIYLIILPINIDNKLELNRYENIIVNFLELNKYILVLVLSLTSIVFAIGNRKENGLRNSYLLFPIVILSFILPYKAIYMIGLLSGILVVYFTNKKNYVAIDSYFIFSLFIILATYIAALFVSTFFIDRISLVIKKEIESNIGIIEYKEDFFQYISPIDEGEYVNLNIEKDGKKYFGYIDKSGNTKIPFDYDFATAFYEIEAYDKNFVIAAVSTEEITEVIMKNKRVVMSYISEYESYDYGKKTEEFEKIIKKVFGEKEVRTEIAKGSTNIITKEVAPKERNQEYTYKYRLNTEKDVLVYESAVGNPTKYVLRNSKEPYAEMKLETEHLMYNEKHLYTFKNNTIPFYDRDKNEQGWFMEDGEKITLNGNAQILDIEEDKVLIKNHSKNTAYFIDYNAKVISPIFRDVIVDENRYLIRTMSDKWMITDKSFKKVFNEEFDVIDTSLLSVGIYLLANLPEELPFNEYNYLELDYMVVTRSGHVILNRSNQVFDIQNQFTGDLNNEEDIEEFIDGLKSIKYINFGDRFYKQEEL